VSISDDLKERNVLKLILLVRFACATLEVGHPIFKAPDFFPDSDNFVSEPPACFSGLGGGWSKPLDDFFFSDLGGGLAERLEACSRCGG
jgi:hypothetical protein